MDPMVRYIHKPKFCQIATKLTLAWTHKQKFVTIFVVQEMMCVLYIYKYIYIISFCWKKLKFSLLIFGLV